MTSDDARALKRARDLAYRYLSLRDRSRAELLTYLEKKDVERGVAEAVLEELAGFGYIDDARFARVYARYLVEYKGLSRYSLRFELKKKGVPEDDAAAAVAGVYGDEAGMGACPDGDCDSDLRYDEFTVAMKLAAKKSTLMRNLGGRNVDEKKARRRITDHLRRKGFSFDIIRKVLNGLKPRP